MNPAKARRQRALTWLVFLVAAVTLVESWFACVAAASEGGRPLPWLWPTTLEAFAITLILVAWDSLVEGRPAKLVRLLLLLTTSVMAAVQVLDAPESALGWITAAWTPIGLNLMVEVGVRLRYDAQRRETMTPPPPTVTDREPTVNPPTVNRPRESFTEPVTLTKNDRAALDRKWPDRDAVRDIAAKRAIPEVTVDAYMHGKESRNGHKQGVPA